MKEVISRIKSEFQAKLLAWNNIQSHMLKVALICLFIALIGLKVFTTVLTFDWLASLFS
jgi:formate hydrogenlyase subunit 4